MKVGDVVKLVYQQATAEAISIDSTGVVLRSSALPGGEYRYLLKDEGLYFVQVSKDKE